MYSRVSVCHVLFFPFRLCTHNIGSSSGGSGGRPPLRDSSYPSRSPRSGPPRGRGGRGRGGRVGMGQRYQPY